MRQLLETRQQVEQYNKITKRDMRLGDLVDHDGCPTCFGGAHGTTHDAVECYQLFPPICRVRARVGVDCPACGNVMMEDKLVARIDCEETEVIMCANRHCPENGKCYKPPHVRLERLFE